MVSVETGVPGGKPLQRILGQMAYTSPAAYRSPLSLLSLWGVAIRFKIRRPVRDSEIQVTEIIWLNE